MNIEHRLPVRLPAPLARQAGVRTQTGTSPACACPHADRNIERSTSNEKIKENETENRKQKGKGRRADVRCQMSDVRRAGKR